MAFSELRRRAGALFVDNAFRGLATVSRWHPRADPARHNVSVQSNVSYGDGPSQSYRVLDVYAPQDRSGAPKPAVLYVHGGGFRILSKDTHWVMALAFARAGYVVFNVDYRLAPTHPFPAAFDDVSAAYAWVVANASSFGATAEKLIIAGESAGANLTLALTLAATHEHSSPLAKRVFDTGVAPIASAPMCGILQVSDTERFVRRKPTMHPFIADRIHEVEHAYLGPSKIAPDAPERDLADPLLWLERENSSARPLPPLFTAVGTKDPLVDDTRRLERAWKQRGARVEAHVFPGEVHAYHAFVWRPAARETWAKKHAFLRSVLDAQ
ncbi:MAG: alpha/beta hydrolase [Myxococcales bacterium]|nr:alpha/beta hydrolase [Myxococcales bacterium]